MDSYFELYLIRHSDGAISRLPSTFGGHESVRISRGSPRQGDRKVQEVRRQSQGSVAGHGVDRCPDSTECAMRSQSTGGNRTINGMSLGFINAFMGLSQFILTSVLRVLNNTASGSYNTAIISNIWPIQHSQGTHVRYCGKHYN
jgi:hypothetical protein